MAASDGHRYEIISARIIHSGLPDDGLPFPIGSMGIDLDPSAFDHDHGNI